MNNDEANKATIFSDKLRSTHHTVLNETQVDEGLRFTPPIHQNYKLLIMLPHSAISEKKFELLNFPTKYVIFKS